MPERGVKQNSRSLSFPINNCPPAKADTTGMGIVNLAILLGVLVVMGGERGAGIKVERWRNSDFFMNCAPATAAAHEQTTVELG